MSGSNSYAPDSAAPAEPARAEPLGLTVHPMPPPDLAVARRTRLGRFKMMALLAVCAAPVVASYLSYYVIRPEGRSNYSELITPPRELPPALGLATLQGAPVAAASLRGQWLIVAVSPAACGAGCEAQLVLQRQLRETLGREKTRVDKVWLVLGEGTPPERTLQAVHDGDPVTVLRAARADVAAWLVPAPGQALEDHLYLVDPFGNWMLRAPADPVPAKLKRDLERLLRAAASWDTPGR